MQRKAILLFAFIVLVLSACTVDTYPPPAPRPLTINSTEATTDDQIAIAMDSHGKVYLARVECIRPAGEPCRIVYEALQVGILQQSRVYFPIDANHDIGFPAITATDSGLAVMAWRSCPNGDFNSRQCTTRFMRGSAPMSEYTLDSENGNVYYSMSTPVVVSRGETVYIVHQVAVGTIGSAIRYCSIPAGAPSCHWVSNSSDSNAVTRKDISAAVSNAGTLHVAWMQVNASDQTIIYNDNVGAPDANMSISHQLTSISGQMQPPVIAIESDDGYLYMVEAANGVPSDTMTILYCQPGNCAGNGGARDVVMAGAEQWSIYGAPAVTASDDTAYVAFEARRNPLTQTEIFNFSYQPGATNPTPNVLFATASTYRDCDPVIVMLDSLPAVGWHQCGFPPATSDIYFSHLGTGGVVIHDAPNDTGRGGLDMASNGTLVAGVWNEIQGDGRLATWLAFNAYMSFMPVTIR